MTFLDSLTSDERNIISDKLEVVHFKEGTCIIEQGAQGDGCYFIDEGRVRVEFDTGETDTDVVLNYLEPGQVMGEFSLLDEQPRSASLFAHTDVTARWLSTKAFRSIITYNTFIGAKLLTAISLNLIQIVRHTNRQLADFMSYDASNQQVDETVANAVQAQKEFMDWSEDQVDALLKDLAKTISNHAEVLAEASVVESGLGNKTDKIAKIQFASQEVYNVIEGKPAAGLLQYNDSNHIQEIATPMGVVLGIIPLTNPVPTMIFKTLICIKSRNALIMSCHRNAMGVGNQAGEIIQDVLVKHGAPVNLVQWIKERSSRKLTNMFMRHRDVSFILATGGPSIVKAAYSSGTPAIGVGAGNAPVYITKTADLEKTAKTIVGSKSFDNGVICGSENNLVIDSEVQDSFIEALKNNGAKVLNSEEIKKLTDAMFDPKTTKLQRDVIGKSALWIANKAEIEADETIKLLIVPQPLDQVSGLYGQEKLAPVLPLFPVTSESEALDICKNILIREGIGHTAIIHTEDKALAERYALTVAANRVLVNVGGSLGCIGGGNGLLPSLTLGCGTQGGTSTTDNVNYQNLLNIKRLAFPV